MLTRLLTLTALLLAQAAGAQELRLFEEIESDNANTNVPQRGPERVVNPGGQTQWSLRSTARFGEAYEAVLVNRSGEVARVNWQAGESATLPNASGYRVTEVKQETVSLALPAGELCISDPTAGVDCVGNMALLSLSTASPLASNGTRPQPQPAQGQAIEGAAGGFSGQQDARVLVDQATGEQVQAFVNPFSGQLEAVPQLSEEEARARAERQAQRAERLGQFEPIRLNEADAPPGTRVVRTPFGDRFVPVRE